MRDCPKCISAAPMMILAPLRERKTTKTLFSSNTCPRPKDVSAALLNPRTCNCIIQRLIFAMKLLRDVLAMSPQQPLRRMSQLAANVRTRSRIIAAAVSISMRPSKPRTQTRSSLFFHAFIFICKSWPRLDPTTKSANTSLICPHPKQHQILCSARLFARSHVQYRSDGQGTHA